jgi:hypothetical protein
MRNRRKLTASEVGMAEKAAPRPLRDGEKYFDFTFSALSKTGRCSHELPSELTMKCSF